MKRLIRFCSLFLCFALLFTVFSVSVSAEQKKMSSYKIWQKNYIKTWENTYNFPTSITFHPNNDEQEFLHEDIENLTAMLLADQCYFYSEYHIAYNNGDLILDSGKKYTLNFSNFYYSALVQAFTGSTYIDYYVRTPEIISFGLMSVDGTVEYFSDFLIEHEDNSSNFSVTLTATPKKNIKKIIITVKSSISKEFPSFSQNYYVPIRSYFGEYNGDDKYQISIDYESQESGLLKESNNLLKGISNWLKGIKEGITNLFNSIAELPSKLWTAIENGLKNLFIPDEQFMTDYSDNWDNLLSQRFGAIYDVSQIMFDFVGNIQVSDATNTIRFPEVSLDFSGSKFTFGGVDVKIVPDNFEVLVNACKLIISVICTFLFINGLRKRYDEVMGVEQ